MDSEVLAKIAEGDKKLISIAAHKLAACGSRVDLCKSLQSTIVPLLALDGFFIVRFNEESGETSLIGKSEVLKNISSNLNALVNQVITNNESSKYLTPPGMAVSTAATIPTQTVNSQDEKPWPFQREHFKSIAGIFDTPNPTLGLWIYRKQGHTSAFNLREINILKYMRPFLIQAIRAVTFQEDRMTYSKIAEHFISSNAPQAVIKHDTSIVLSNKKFTEQINQFENARLPDRLHKKIQLLINEQKQLSENRSFVPHPVYFRLNRRLYEIIITPVTGSDQNQQPTWLLTLKRVSNSNAQLSRALQNANLTRRETEIMYWLQKGLSCPDLAEQLDLSYHTARTHVRNIYKKLGVSSSRELLAFTYQPG